MNRQVEKNNTVLRSGLFFEAMTWENPRAGEFQTR